MGYDDIAKAQSKAALLSKAVSEGLSLKAAEKSGGRWLSQF